MEHRILGQALTFDDVLLVPSFSDVVPADADVRTRFTRRVPLNVPIVSAAMDTVTESSMAIALARLGGIGIVHKNLTPKDQALQVMRVKRSVNGVIADPVTLPPDAPLHRARELMEIHKISGVPIIDSHDKVVGILTNRDLRFVEGDPMISEVMTSEDLVTASPDTDLQKAREVLRQAKVEKLLLVDDDNVLRGLITIRDLDNLDRYPAANLDPKGRLLVGAAVGVFDDERVAALVDAHVDVIVIDTAHGHSKNVVEALGRYKTAHANIDIVAGNIATADGARTLADAGADAVKVGVGPGSICTTRVIAGAGMPQLSAISSVAEALKDTDVPLIADGGIRYSGDIVKALAAGGHSVMLGSMLAGVEESPGEVIYYRGRTFKSVRGMGSIGAMMAGSADRYGQGDVRQRDKLVPEGIEGRVPFKGALETFLHQLVGGIRSGMGYTGCHTIEELRTRTRFNRVSMAGLQESHPHDVQITREAPNYLADQS